MKHPMDGGPCQIGAGSAQYYMKTTSIGPQPQANYSTTVEHTGAKFKLSHDVNPLTTSVTWHVDNSSNFTVSGSGNTVTVYRIGSGTGSANLFAGFNNGTTVMSML